MLKGIGFYLIILISLSSCFEVVEDVSFKKDGSGVLKLIINLSQSKREINTLMKLDSSSGYKIPREKDINAYLDQALRTLKTTEGLSKVSIKRDYNSWIFELKADFQNTQSLEEGIRNLHHDFSEGKPFSFKNRIAFNGKTLEREIVPPDPEVRRELNRPTERKIFAAAKYTSIYRFENDVESCSNKRAKISPSRKAIMLQSNILNLINGNETIQNIIKLK